MELAGTLVLPAAIAFTLYLLIITMIPGTVKPIISLILLAIILGIPGLLIVMTSRKIAYIGWMGIYLLSLPIWNLVLPLYAFLHMVSFLASLLPPGPTLTQAFEGRFQLVLSLSLCPISSCD